MITVFPMAALALCSCSLSQGIEDSHAAVSCDDGKCVLYTSARDSFRALWESINGADSWVANPWVWVVAFKRVTP